jgi:UPF0271 protein
VQLHHVKPHGALYMQALEDDALSRAIIEASLAADENLMIYTIAGSATAEAARRCGMRWVAEFFADRGYYADGRVKMFDWSLAEVGGGPESIARRVAGLLQQGTVPSLDGGSVRVVAQTICVHSDTPGAGEIVRAVRTALAGVQIAIRAPQLDEPASK